MLKENGVHLGWNRADCEEQAYYICQLDQTLNLKLQPFVNPPKIVIPLDSVSGPKVYVTDTPIVSAETNVGYSRMWSKSGLRGYAMFSEHLNGQSYVEADLKGIFSASIKKITITFWVMPTDSTIRPVLARTNQ